MPVLGQASLAAGATKRGVRIPTGSLDVAKAAALACATTRTEWVIFGDSTSAGSATGSPTNYSWITKLRTLLIAAGYADGGRGVIGMEDIGSATLDAVDNISGVVSSTNWTGGGTGSDPLLTSSFKSSTANASVVFQGYATSCRLHYTLYSTQGGFAYSVNGGAETTVEADVNGYSIESVLITGMPAGLNTVTVRNIGSAKVKTPSIWAVNNGGAGSLAAATYYYKVTSVDGSGGESLPSPAVSRVTSASGANQIVIIGQPGVAAGGTGGGLAYSNATSYNIYRSTTSGGTYGLIGNIASAGDGFTNYTDTNGTATTAAPTTDTAGRNAGNGRVTSDVAPDMLKSTGITVHKHAVSGTTSTSWFGYAFATSYGSPPTQDALGVTVGISGSANGFDWGMPQSSRPTHRNPSLAISALGINDMQGLGLPATAGAPTTAELDAANRAAQVYAMNLEHFVRLSRAAGADPLIVIPHFNLALATHYYAGVFIAAANGVAAAHGVAMIDFNEALGPVNGFTALGYSTSVHTNQAAYDAEAAFLFTALQSYFAGA